LHRCPRIHGSQIFFVLGHILNHFFLCDHLSLLLESLKFQQTKFSEKPSAAGNDNQNGVGNATVIPHAVVADKNNDGKFFSEEEEM
jgi:hypothetical protein